MAVSPLTLSVKDLKFDLITFQDGCDHLADNRAEPEAEGEHEVRDRGEQVRLPPPALRPLLRPQEAQQVRPQQHPEEGDAEEEIRHAAGRRLPMKYPYSRYTLKK